RLLCSRAEVDSYKLRGGFLAESDWPKLTRAAGVLSESPIFIDDSPVLTVLEMRAKARRLKKEKGLGLLVVDYLQLVRSGHRMESREREIAEISRGLKALAKELHVPVVALSQLNRGLENRQDKRPMLSDLRESGCLTGDTLITNAKTGEQVSIQQLAERDRQTPFPVFAVDENYRVRPYHLVKAFSSGKKKVFLLKTRSGRKIRASANHPFLRIDGWKPLDQLQPRDAIALPREMAPLQPEKFLSDNELILLAHLLGDGCILPNRPYHYTSGDWENVETVQKAAKKLFGIEGRVVMQKNWWHLYLPSPYHLTHNVRHPITNWYRKLGIDPVHSWKKRIPRNLMQAPQEDIALFLRHLWATDGNFSWKLLRGRKKAGYIYYASSSEILACQVQHLLLMLGIHATLREVPSAKGYRCMYHLYVEGAEEQLKFCERVGIAGCRRVLVPEVIAALQEIKQNKNVDVIPARAWKTVIEPAKERMGIGWREFSQRLGMSYCGSTLFKHGISRARMVRVARALPNDETLLHLAHSDIFWDKIHSITELGMEEVYDATVEGAHNFAANDIIVHNSLEQDSDVVMFIYRDEMYNSESPEQGKAEILVSKQRNGPTGKVNLAFLAKYTRFDNLAKGADEYLPPPGADAVYEGESDEAAPF
ncbi:MAG: replicative DNA helicase, partial [Deltaproteobacteria bacterium]|nr:replicative DNA helicase [Deltaproteobacteria bacterium]